MSWKTAHSTNCLGVDLFTVPQSWHSARLPQWVRAGFTKTNTDKEAITQERAARARARARTRRREGGGLGGLRAM